MANLALAFDILARDRASRTFRNVGDSADRAGKKGDGFGKKMSSGMATAAKGLIGLAAAAGFGFGAMVKDAAESAKIGRLTDAVIKSTGGAAKVTAGHVGSLAEAISNKTAVDDEAIQSGSNLLLTFTKVRNEVGKGNDIFDRATQAAVDMSVALGTDIKGASLQLGKALNDPVKGMTSLSRAGVSFTQQQKDQVKAMVKAGDTLGAQKLILKEMQTQFGGAAEAAADPMERLRTVAGNLGEKIGGVLLPYVEQFATYVSDEVVPAVTKFIDEFQNGTGAGGEFRDRIAEVVDKVKDAAKWIGDNADTVKTLVAAVASAVAIFQSVKLAVNAWKVAQLALNVVLAANPVGIVVLAIAALVAGIIIAYNESETFRNIVDTALKGIASAWRWLWNSIIAPIIRFILNGFANLTGGIASFLRALSNIPGFGWAKDAADKMDGAADKARGLARGILDIPSDKQVTITVQARANDLAIRAMGLASSGSSAKAIAMVEGRAIGGPIVAGRPYLVGEQGPELIVPKASGTVMTTAQTRAAIANGTSGGGGGFGRLHPHDIEALADAMSRRKSTAVIDRGSMMRDLVTGL